MGGASNERCHKNGKHPQGKQGAQKQRAKPSEWHAKDLYMYSLQILS